MATATINITATTDDAYVRKGGPAYPPDGSLAFSASTSGDVWLRKARSAAAEYYNDVGFLRFDTSALGAGATVSAAELHLNVVSLQDANARSLSIEWYDSSNWPIDTGDYADDVGTTAYTGLISSLSYGANTIALLNVSNVNRTGYTGLRLGISGGAPTSVSDYNQVVFDGLGSGTAAYLVVTYTAGYQNKVLGVAPEKIAKVCGVPTANIRKVSGL